MCMCVCLCVSAVGAERAKKGVGLEEVPGALSRASACSTAVNSCREREGEGERSV